MPTKIFIALLCSLLLGLIGCKKSSSSASPVSATQESAPGKSDVCALITSQEIEAVQGSPVTETKSSSSSAGGLLVSQCYYATAGSNKSVSLALTQSDPASSAKRSPRAFWKETFGRFEGEAKPREGDEEKRESLREQDEEKSTPPKKIEGLGDEAYWTANRVGGALYVLRNDASIRISVGGPDNEGGKLNKSKELAQKALQRL
jgi:hypothetical protein